MKRPPNIPAALLVIYIHFLQLKKHDIEYFGSIHYPLVCVGNTESCPAYAVNWLATSSIKNSLWHSHPYALNKFKNSPDDIEYISPEDLLFFVSHRSKKTFLFCSNCVYQFDIPKNLKYSYVKNTISGIVMSHGDILEVRKGGTISFPITNKEFCKMLGIKRKCLLTKSNALKMWKTEKREHYGNNGCVVD